MSYPFITEEEVRAMFTLARIKVLQVRPLPDGYGYPVSDPRYYEMPPRCVWWFVKTPAGWIEIGWRKRVISIDWSDTSIPIMVTKDPVTCGQYHVHADSEHDALRYLTRLGEEVPQ